MANETRKDAERDVYGTPPTDGQGNEAGKNAQGEKPKDGQGNDWER